MRAVGVLLRAVGLVRFAEQRWWWTGGYGLMVAGRFVEQKGKIYELKNEEKSVKGKVEKEKKLP